MSPVNTATRSCRGKDSRVRSRRLVLPEPGELIRFRHNTPCSWNCARRLAATRSFSLSTFRSNGTRSILFHLQISQFQFVSTDARGFKARALRTARIVIAHDELACAELTTMAPGTNFNSQFKRRQIGLENDGFETETQCILIDGRHLANADADFARVGSGMQTHLGSDCLQHRTRDSHLVHISLTDAWQLVARQHVDDAGRT